MARLHREDLIIWSPPAGGVYYLLERAALEKEGVKKCVHRAGTSADAVFPYRELAEAELMKFPTRAEGEAAPAAAASGATG